MCRKGEAKGKRVWELVCDVAESIAFARVGYVCFPTSRFPQPQ